MKSVPDPTVRNRLIISILLQAVLYTILWLWNEYVATFVTLIFPLMVLVILVLSGIANLIEPSRIPAWYYLVMVASIMVPIIISGIIYYLNGGRFDWLEN